MQESLVIFLHSSSYDRLFQAVNLLNTASSMGWRCHLFLFFDALGSFMAGEWDDAHQSSGGSRTAADQGAAETRNDAGLGARNEPDTGTRVDADARSIRARDLRRAFELANNPPLSETLEQARKNGLTVCACSASVRLLGLDVQSVKSAVDEIIGLPTMLQITSTARHALYI
jgi:peroxiredoxin family protein